MLDSLTRREQQILTVLLRRGEASAADVVAELGEPDAYDSLRVTLGMLVKKGAVKRRREGRRYLYTAQLDRQRAGRSMARAFLKTFFGKDPGRAVLTLLDLTDKHLTHQELDAIAERIEDARRNRSRA